MTTKFVVASYNSITETSSRELYEYKSRQYAQDHADAMNSKHGSDGVLGTNYYVIEIDEDGTDIPLGPGDISTGDPELDALIMGDDR